MLLFALIEALIVGFVAGYFARWYHVWHKTEYPGSKLQKTVTFVLSHWPGKS